LRYESPVLALDGLVPWNSVLPALAGPRTLGRMDKSPRVAPGVGGVAGRRGGPTVEPSEAQQMCATVIYRNQVGPPWTPSARVCHARMSMHLTESSVAMRPCREGIVLSARTGCRAW
jgi:hypothetical protein